MSVTTFVILISAVLALAITIRWLSNEHFDNLPEIGTRYVCPTRNQSFDIRGDIPIPRNDWPVHNSSIGSRQPELCTYRRLE
jgi:hypothetical protein